MKKRKKMKGSTPWRPVKISPISITFSITCKVDRVLTRFRLNKQHWGSKQHSLPLNRLLLQPSCLEKVKFHEVESVAGKACALKKTRKRWSPRRRSWETSPSSSSWIVVVTREAHRNQRGKVTGNWGRLLNRSWGRSHRLRRWERKQPSPFSSRFKKIDSLMKTLRAYYASIHSKKFWMKTKRQVHPCSLLQTHHSALFQSNLESNRFLQSHQKLRHRILRADRKLRAKRRENSHLHSCKRCWSQQSGDQAMAFYHLEVCPKQQRREQEGRERLAQGNRIALKSLARATLSTRNCRR